MELPGTKHLQASGDSWWCGSCLKFVEPIYVSHGDKEPQAACEECLLEDIIAQNGTVSDADCPVSTTETEDKEDEVIACQYPDDMLEVGLKTDTDDEDLGAAWYELGPSCMRVPASAM